MQSRLNLANVAAAAATVAATVGCAVVHRLNAAVSQVLCYNRIKVPVEVSGNSSCSAVVLGWVSAVQGPRQQAEWAGCHT
jgi:hypothetical protein